MCEEKNVSQYFDIKKKNVIASMTVSYLLAKMQTATPKEAVRLSVELRKWHRKKLRKWMKRRSFVEKRSEKL